MVVDTERAQVFVEIAKPRRQFDRLDAGCFDALRERRHRRISGRVHIVSDVEPAQRQWQQCSSEVVGRKCGGQKVGNA